MFASALASEQVILSPYGFNARARRVRFVEGNPATHGDSRLTTQIQTIGATKSTLVDSYDAVGNRTGRSLDGVLTTWVYDDANRLTNQQTTGGFATFTMDLNGNILVKNQQGSNPLTMTYDAASRLVTSLQGAKLVTYTYDANGNLENEFDGTSGRDYAYDKENRLNDVSTDGSGEFQYGYDGDGLRRWMIDITGGSVRTTFVWDGTDYLGEVSS